MERLLDTSSPVALQALDPGEVREGAPRAGSRELTVIGGCEVGVWEMTPGTATDTEADEVFVVLSGRARVTFEDGDVVELGAGNVVRLREGERTTWQVEETLRKVYLT